MSTRAWLVMNADDAGAHPSADDAILRCRMEGILTSASVLIAGATAAPFVDRALEAGLGLGLHLNLTEGRAVSGPMSTLTDANGHFAGTKQDLWRKALAGEVDPAQVRTETLAQWERARRLGFLPDHINGHNHVHVLPGIAEGVLAALEQLGQSPWIRIPEDPEEPPLLQPPFHLPAPLAPLARSLREQIADRYPTPTTFRGLAFAEQPGESRLHATLPLAFEGVLEWMVHPGARPGSKFLSALERERETRALCARGLRERLAQGGWTLASFAELPRR